MKRAGLLVILIFSILISGCGSDLDEVQLPQLEDSPTRILISEVFAGIDGNNQADFIELYNSGSEIADLDGYELWYQLHDDAEPVLLYRWQDTALVPPRGYYALTQSGQLFGVEADQHFSQALVPSRGGVSLQSGDSVEDQVSWGTGPMDFAEGKKAIQMESGVSLQRSPESLQIGNGDSDQNDVDFSLNTAPSLMNTGSPINHPLADNLLFSVDLPYQVKPGEEFEISYQVENQTGIDLTDLKISLPLPEDFIILPGPDQVSSDGEIVEISIVDLTAGEVSSGSIPLQAEWTFSDYSFRNVYLQAANWDVPAFNPPFNGEIGGGAIPISTARELVDREVVVEGISTMYVGGFYAGSGAKFYVEDESGGIQVYVSGAGNSLVVPLGSTVQIRGKIELYRDSIELIPSSEDLVEILEAGNKDTYFQPDLITIEEINNDPDSLPGKLVAVEGRVARAEEFSYSYEMDLFDEIGNLVTLYIDKNTTISIEEVEAGQYYKISGIMELFDGRLRLYPRLQSDLSRIYPPGLYITADTPTTTTAGESFQVVFTIINRGENDSNLLVRSPIDPNLEIISIGQNGQEEDGDLVWKIQDMAGNGHTTELTAEVKLGPGVDYTLLHDYQVVSDNYPQPAYGPESYTFAGETVPIWAVQGTGKRSPFILAKITTQGVITGILPELEGFWIQELSSDDDPRTSPGLFVRTGANLPDITVGDLVSVTGRIREVFQQTELELISLASIEVLGSSPLPLPVALDPPLIEGESQVYYEALEGCLVSVPGTAVVVGPTTRYGEFAMVLSKHGLERAWQGTDNGMLIHVDDGSSSTHEVRDEQLNPVGVGDRVSGVNGILAFTYGNYKIEPTADFEAFSRVTEPPTLQALQENEFSIMSWNVENLFDFLVPHPSSPPLPSVSEYKWQTNRVAQTIAAAGYPTIIGFQEVETIEVLEDVAEDPLLAPYLYQASLIEGTDSRGIDVGYLVRGDMAALVNETQYPAPGNITSRPPLLIEVELLNSSGQTIYILNNHFTSMSGGEEATEPRRTAQAAWNAEIAKEITSEHPGALVAVIGDLNSFYKSPPLETLEMIGLVNLFDYLDETERYTYVYQGLSQVLDHILVNPDLDAYLVRVEVLHSNADFPLPYSDDDGYLHKSDHDPVVAVFMIP